MNISVTFRNIKASENIKNYAKKKINRLARYIGNNIDVKVVFSVDKFRRIVELSLIIDGYKIYGREESDDMYTAMDMTLDKIKRQIEKYKNR
ncbi:MAG: hypothetical protein AMJ45_00570 [Syntrophobacter sp. DG_60]|nr:MAG: hypothetical protein AMJ45_00570 [Syntrophobacter sp. DG_60]